MRWHSLRNFNLGNVNKSSVTRVRGIGGGGCTMWDWRLLGPSLLQGIVGTLGLELVDKGCRREEGMRGELEGNFFLVGSVEMRSRVIVDRLGQRRVRLSRP